MNISINSMAGFGLSAYSRGGKPLTIISTHYHHKSEPRTRRSTERDTRANDSHHG